MDALRSMIFKIPFTLQTSVILVLRNPYSKTISRSRSLAETVIR